MREAETGVTGHLQYGLTIAVGLLLAAVLYLSSLYSYLLFHSLAELFSISISLAIFIFAWNSRRLVDNDYLLFLGIAYLFISLFDLVHTLGYTGMGVFPGYGANLPTQLWIAARYTESLSLLAAPLFLYRGLKVFPCFAAFTVMTAFVFGAIFYWHIFPDCFVNGKGLTPFKIISEYLISLILSAAVFFLYRHRSHFAPEVFRLMALSIVLTICSELAFTFYVDVYGLSNLIGHFFKIVSFYLVYRAIIAVGLVKPYDLLFKGLVEKEEELQRANNELELRVKRRTGELDSANRQLQREIAEKEAAQLELTKSEKRLKAIIRAAEDVSFVLMDISGEEPKIIEFSPGAERLLGYSRNEIIGTTIDKFHTGDDIRRFPGILRLLKDGRKGFEGELTMLRRDGDSFPAYVSFTPIQNSFNGPVALAVSVDITKSKLAEEQSRRWTQVFEHAEWGVAVSVADDWNLDIMNPAFARMHGYTIQELVGKTFSEVLAPDLRGKFLENIPKVGETGHLVFESSHLRRDGSIFPVIIDITSVIDDRGMGRYQIINIQDISQRKEAEKKLLTAKEEWERTFDSIGDIALILDPDLRIVRINRQGYETFGAESGDLLGKYCYEVFRKSSRPCKECPIIPALEDGETRYGEVYHESLDRSYMVSASPVMDENRKLASLVYFAKDITTNKNLEKQLRQAQKMEAIGTLAGGIAHDFNNILTPVIGYAEMALESLPAESETVSDIKMVIGAADRAKELVRQILAFSRQTEEELQPLKIQLIIKEALKLLRSSIPTSIEIRQDIDIDCPPVMADPSQVHQIIMNLCTNAYHAMREKGGILEVSLQTAEIGPGDLKAKFKLRAGDYARLTVSDTGQGMDKGVQERIFEPYYTTKAQGEGTGLGLSVVHGIVENMGGAINVYSEPGKGTVFNIYLPVTKDMEPVKPASREEAAASFKGTERILVLDDDEDIVQLHKRVLGRLGYKVTAFTNSEECLDDFRLHLDDFDLIVTDMNMPGMTGDVFVKKALEARADIPIILCTGFSDRINEEQAKSYGIKAFVMKPIASKQLARIVRKVLDQAGSGQ